MKGCLRNIFIGFGVLLVLMVILVVATGGGNGSSTTSGTAASEDTAAQSDTPEEEGAASDEEAAEEAPAQEEAAQTFNVGDTVTSANWEVVVNAPERAAEVGNEFMNEQASGTFLVVPVQITNRGTESSTVNSSQFTLIDGQGREFEVDTDAMTALALSDENPMLFLEQINPDLATEARIVFDIPDTAQNVSLQFRGAMFSDPATISLGE